MNTRENSSAPQRRTCGFTLVETMVAVAIFAVGSGIIYQSFLASLVLTAKNTALNSGNQSLQHSYYRLLSTIEASPILVDCANFNNTTKTFTAVSTGTWGNSVRFMRQLPISCYIIPGDGSGYTVTNPPPPTRSVSLSSSTQFVFVNYNASLYSPAGITTSARFIPAFPSVSQTVNGGTSPGVKPGISFDIIDTSVSGLIGLHLPSQLGSNTFLDCNRGYFMVESAFAVTQSPTDGHKELLYFADTSKTNSPLLISNCLDGNNQTQANDATIPNGGTAGTFCMVATGDAVQTLLPIRSQSAINIMTRRGGAAARNDTWLNINAKFRQRQDL